MEFIVPGAPRSANANPRSRRRWRERVADAARARLQPGDTPIGQDVAVLIIYFYKGETALDVDNIAKSLLDGLKGLIFQDDAQISELLIRKTRLSSGFSLIGASSFLINAIELMSQADTDFVYVRTSTAPDHGRMP